MTSTTLPPSFGALSSILSNQDLRFPGIDAAVLDTHDAEVAAAEDDVRRAEEALAAARERLRACELTALEKGERALSYLRIFAAENEAVAGAISGITLGRSVAKAPAPNAPRRGRPRKSEGELPFEATEMAASPA